MSEQLLLAELYKLAKNIDLYTSQSDIDWDRLCCKKAYEEGAEQFQKEALAIFKKYSYKE